MNYPDQRTYQRLLLNKDLLCAASNRGSQFQSISQSINHYLLTKSILTMNRKTTFLRWLGSFMVGAILLFGSSQLMAQDGNRDITGSEITAQSSFYTAGATNVVLDFTTYMVPPDGAFGEWVGDVEMDFPAGVTVTSASIMENAGQTNWLNYDGQTGDGALVTWSAPAYGNYLQDGDVCPFTVTVDIDAGFTGNMNIGWSIIGEVYGDAPHTTTGTVNISEAAPRLEISPLVLDLGDRPINSWTEPAYFTLENTGVGALTVNNAEIAAADFFAVHGDFPVTLETGESVMVGISATGDATPGMLMGDFVAQWGAGREVAVAEFMANAYTPQAGDVVENALDIPVVPAPAATPIVMGESSRAYNGFYKNYILPNDLGSSATDADEVFKLEPATDVLISFTTTLGTINWAIYSEDFNGEGGPMSNNALVQGVDNITDFELFTGTYYVVASYLNGPVGATFDVTAMPAPDAATYVAPADGAIDITNGMDLEWTFGANTLEYQVVLGTTYPPATVVVDWTDDLATAYELANLEPNLQYFWQVNTRNNSFTTPGDIWGFTTTLTPPSDLTGNAEVYEGEDVVLTWESPVDRAFLGYNVYRDGVMQNAAMLTEATYTDVAPAYNMAPGYEYTVTAIFDEGESDPSDPFTAQVTGEGTLNGNVSSLVPVAPVSGATVTMTGVDEFGEDQSYSTTTDATGNYTADVFAGTYTIRVVADGFLNAEVTGVALAYGATVTTDFTLNETPFPVAVVTASEFGENILIEWSFDAANFVPQVYPFETEGMSEAQIQKMWNEFLTENNFDATVQGSDRALVEFQVWREKSYLPGAFEMIGTTSQYQFVDFDWGLQDWGVYKWYVVAVYDLNESTPVASNPIDNDMNTVVDVTVALNSAESPAGTLVEFTNVDESPELVYSALLPASGMNTWNEFRRGTYDILVSLPGYGEVTETGVDIFDETSFEWLLEELLATPEDLYVTPTGFATWSGGSGEVPFAPVMEAFDDGIPADWTQVTYSGDGFWEFCDNCGAAQDPINTDGKFAVADSDGNTTLVFDVGLFTSAFDLSGESTIYLDYDRDFQDYAGDGEIAIRTYSGGTGAANFEEELDWATADDPSGGIHKTYMFDPSTYADPSAVYFEFWYSTNGGTYAWGFGIDNVLVTNAAPAPRSFETYKVFLDGTLLGEVTETEYQHGTFGETLVDGETYTTGVAAVFTTGQSATAEFTWLYVACDNYDAPSAFTAEQVIGTLDVELNWTNVDAAALDTISALRIYRNGEEYAELDFTTAAVDTYLDEDLEFDTYNYCLTYIYDSGAETCVDAVCSEDVVITGGGYVNGTVTAFDGGDAIEGAIVTIFNDDFSFDFTTDINGIYEGEVVDGTYDYLVSAATFESQTLEAVTITFGETVTNDFQLLEFPYPVSSVVATEINDNSVLVDWSAQAPVVEEWLIYDNDVMGFGGIGAEVADYSLIWGSKFVPAQLTEYGTGYVSKVAVYQLPAVGDFLTEVRILAGENGETVLYSQDVTGTLTGDAWNIIELDEAVAFDNTENLWIAMYVERPGDVFNEPTAGALQVIPNRYDYFAYNGAAWTSISGEYGINNQAWMLRGFVTTSAGREVALGQGDFTTTGHKDYSVAKSVSSGRGMVAADKPNAKFPVYAHETTRELVGYSIYRTTCETGDLEFLGFTLDEQFTDNTWGSVEAGVYKWGVVAEYDNNESEVAYSNCLDKDMITAVSVQVTTNSGDSPEGTDVMFTNISEPGLELVYEVELDETGFYVWEEFRKGEYDIYVEKNGFAPIELMGYVIDGPEAFEWLLEELLLPVADLYVTPTGFATWRSGGEIPFEPYMENFDEGLPETWTVVDGGSTTDTWFNTANYSGNSVDGTPFMFANSDAAGPGSTMNEQLISPVINAENAEELYLMFDYVYQYIGNEHFAVDVMVDGDWVEVFRSEADSGPFPWGPTVNEMIDITEYASDMLQVRFNYVSNGWNWYVAVDNVVVTDNMDRYADRELQYYKVWLDNNFITDTENTFWQYDVTNLVPGQDYLAEVAAVYSNGISERMQYVWTYIPCEDYAGPQVYNGEVINNNDVLLTWSDVEPMELIQITQNPGAPSNGYFQQYGYGYGVAYDLSAYPDALVNSLDFHHASWGVTGTWEYNIHIYDWDTKTLIETVGPITTTGNDIWEMGVDLGDVATGGVSTVAILMEPLSNSPTDAYPDISSDDATNPQGSIYGDLSDPNAIGASTIGNFLMEMYIYTAYGAVRATPVNFDYVEAPAAQAKSAVNPVVEAPVITQSANSREDDLFVGTNVYRNGMLIAEMIQDTFYVDESVNGGEYEYCIRYVYESGAMTCEGAYCLDIAIPCEAPKNLTGEYLWEYNNGNPEFGSLITWEPSTAPLEEWLYYDDGTNVDGIGGPATFSWAIKFDPAQLADFDGASLTKIQIYNRTGASDELRIFEGTNAATLLHTQTLSGLGIEAWEEVDLTDAVLIDVTKELWIVVYTTDGVNYPAGCGPTQNEPNGDLITLDGVLWEHLSDYALPYTWNLRGFVTTMAGVTAALPMDTPADTYSNDDRAELTVSGQGTGENPVLESNSTRELSVFNVYRSDNGTDYSLLTTVPYDAGTTTYEYFDTDVDIAGYYYQVTALHTYDDGTECESDPAFALDIPEDDFVYVFVTNINETGAAEARLFPNPATDMVNVEAAGINRITVINAVGQVVYDIEVDAAKTQLNTASLESGVYMVRINTENGMVTKRMSIVR
jgi:hypothetical protein